VAAAGQKVLTLLPWDKQQEQQPLPGVSQAGHQKSATTFTWVVHLGCQSCSFPISRRSGV
jgi:hypothetical protein